MSIHLFIPASLSLCGGGIFVLSTTFNHFIQFCDKILHWLTSWQCYPNTSVIASQDFTFVYFSHSIKHNQNYVYSQLLALFLKNKGILERSFIQAYIISTTPLLFADHDLLITLLNIAKLTFTVFSSISQRLKDLLWWNYTLTYVMTFSLQ